MEKIEFWPFLFFFSHFFSYKSTLSSLLLTRKTRDFRFSFASAFFFPIFVPFLSIFWMFSRGNGCCLFRKILISFLFDWGDCLIILKFSEAQRFLIELNETFCMVDHHRGIENDLIFLRNSYCKSRRLGA